MHEISSGPCEETSRRNATPLPPPIASPAIVPEQQPVEEQRPGRDHAERHAAHEREERHLDVVEHDRERERRGRRGVVVAPLRRRVGRRREVAGNHARGRRRIGQPPGRARHRGHQQQQPRREQQRRPLRQPPPVAGHEELPDRGAAPGPRVHARPGAQHERLQPRDERIARIAPPREREVGRRRPVELAEPAHAAGAEPLGLVTGSPQRRVEFRPRLGALGGEALGGHDRSPLPQQNAAAPGIMSNARRQIIEGTNGTRHGV